MTEDLAESVLLYVMFVAVVLLVATDREAPRK